MKIKNKNYYVFVIKIAPFKRKFWNRLLPHKKNFLIKEDLCNAPRQPPHTRSCIFIFFNYTKYSIVCEGKFQNQKSFLRFYINDRIWYESIDPALVRALKVMRVPTSLGKNDYCPFFIDLLYFSNIFK